MKKIAIYGKGGVGKSTIVSNLSAALSEQGLRVMQIGCDPKADSTIGLRRGEPLATILQTVREKKNDFLLEEITAEGYAGVICAEAGGPIPGHGCAGRGIMTALEKLEAKGAYEKFAPDVVFYDVLGDVVCGGFSMPMRKGCAEEVYIVTSGENMSVYAAANIAMALDNFKGRGYASLGGVILNRRAVPGEDERVKQFCADFGTSVTGEIARSSLVPEADAIQRTVLEAFPGSDVAQMYRELAAKMAGRD